MKTLTFPVSINMGGDIDVDVDLSDEECKALAAVMEDEEFCDAESLSKLYDRVIEAAYDSIADFMAEDNDLLDDEFDGEYDFEKCREYAVENYELSADYPENADFEK